MPDLGLWSSPVRAIDISADKRLIALGDAEGVVDVFDVVSGVRRTYDPHNVRPEPPQPNYGTDDTTGVSEIFRVRRTRVPELAVTALQFEQDGYALWISYDDGAVRVIEPITMAPIDETGPEEQVRGGFAISPDGRIMAVAGNRLVRWPNANTREWVFPLGETVERHDGFAIDPETGTVAIITSNGLHKSLRTFTAQGRPMAHKSVTASYCVLAMGGDTFLAPSGRDRFIAFNASSGHVVESHVIPFGFISEASCVSNGRRVAFGDSAGRLIVFDRDDGGWLARHQVHDTGLAITSLAWVGASDLLAVGSAGSVHFLDSETGDARSRLTNLGRSGWVFDSPSGRFDAPQANWSDIVFTHPNNRLTTVSNGQLLLARLTPGLLNRALKEPDDLVERLEPVKTTTIQAPRIAFLEPIPTIELSNGLSQPGTMLFHNGEVEREIPLITIRVPDSVVTAGPKIADAMSVRVRLLVEDAGSGIGDCRLLRNRQVVEFFSAPQGRPVAITHQTQVELGPGVSELSAFCFSSENVPGMTERITLATDDVAEHRGTAYVIAIGINDYRNSLLRLKYAGADADLFGRAVSTALEGTGRYSEVVRLVLRDSDVTKSMLSGVFDILAGQTSSDALAAVDSDVENIDRLQPVTVQDAVVVFFAGHGEMEGDTYRILLQDYDESADASSTLTDADFRDIFEGLNATQLILVIDACHAGGALSLRGGQLGPFNSTTFAQMAYDKGVFFLGAALDEQLALEERSFGHGLLTHVLVNEGLLTGKADRIPADDVITVREFLEYPLTGVPALHAELMRENVPLANSITNSPFRNFEIVGASTGVLQTPMAHFPAYGLQR